MRRGGVVLVDAEEVVADGDSERRLEEPLIPDGGTKELPGSETGPPKAAGRSKTIGGGLISDSRVYFANADSRGKNAAYAVFTLACAARIVWSSCFDAKLVSIARCPT